MTTDACHRDGTTIMSPQLNRIPRLPRFPLAQLLERDHNNLDLVRLCAACLVIFGHSFIIVRDPAYPLGTWDPSQYLHYEGVYSASIAVKIFFFISGLLVTNSLLRKGSVTHYCMGRFFRVWPGLFAVVAFSAFVVGPVFTQIPLSHYFAGREIYRYVLGSLLVLMPGTLPGVFAGNPLPNLLNGALWSLTYEAGAYVALLFLGLLGVLRSRTLCFLLLLVIFVDPMLKQPVVFRWLGTNPQIAHLPPCFAFGAFLALFKDRVTLTPVLLLAVTGVFFLVKGTVAGPLAFLVSLFLILLYFSGLGWVRKLRLKSDISYGTFLWGFLIQQMLASSLASCGLVYNLLVSLVAALAAGWLSWHFVERPAMQAGAQLTKWLNPPVTAAPPSGQSPVRFPSPKFTLRF